MDAPSDITVDLYRDEILADERMRIFDIKFGSGEIIFEFAGAFIACIHAYTTLVGITNRSYGKFLKPGRVYKYLLFCAGDVGRALGNRGYVREKIARKANCLAKFYEKNTYTANVGAAVVLTDIDAVQVGRARSYLGGPPVTTSFERYLRHFTVRKLVHDLLPQPIAEEIIDGAAFTKFEIDRAGVTIAGAAHSLGVDFAIFARYIDEACAGKICQRCTVYDDQLKQYDAAECEIAALYPRAAKLLPPIPTSGGYHAGVLPDGDLPSFAEIEAHLAAKESR